MALDMLYVALCVYILCINALLYALYGFDKRAARRGDSRIPEATLLTLALLGGSPGAFLASRRFKHKTKKTSYRLRFWLIIAIQTAALFYYMITNL